jgi:hypothetical protein
VFALTATSQFAYDLVVTCSPIELSGNTLSPGTATVPATDDANPGAADRGLTACSAGKFATGFDGKYGSEVDRVGLTCQLMSKVNLLFLARGQTSSGLPPEEGRSSFVSFLVQKKPPPPLAPPVAPPAARSTLCETTPSTRRKS